MIAFLLKLREFIMFMIFPVVFSEGVMHYNQSEFLVAVSGSFEVVLNDGEKENTINKPNIGLLINPGIWRELQNFSSGAVCLVVACDVYI